MAASSDPITVMGYHSVEFWKELTIGAVTPAEPRTILAATKDLCRHFVAREKPVLFMEKAAKLAAQFRNLKDGRLTELLVDHAGLQQLFSLDPSVLFDIQVYSWDLHVAKASSEESMKTADAAKRLVDHESTLEEQVAPLPWIKDLLPLKMPEPNKSKDQPLTIVEEDWPTSRLRLSFSNMFLYKGKDRAWLEGFISTVDRLTLAQALVFGPAFASLFVILGIPARTSSGVWQVASQMARLCDTALDRADSSLAKMVGPLEVKMPPAKKLQKLLAVYATVKLPRVYFNTVVGGFMYAAHKRKWSILVDDTVTFVLICVRAFHNHHTPLASCLEHIKMMSRLNNRPRMADLYFACVQRSFPDSWKAFCRVIENFDTPTRGKYDPFWDCSRAFADHVFDELSYERNHRVCNVTAVVEDLIDGPPGSCVWPEYGYTYSNLVQDKPSSFRISRSDALLAEEIFKILQKNAC